MSVPVLDLAAEYRSLRADIDAAVARVIDRTAFVGGEEVQRFEAEFAAYLGAPHAVGVANGSDAVELALQALGVGPGDAVLTVPFTFAATVEAIVRSGATPLFVDVDDDFTIDVDAAAALLASRPVKAIIAVHLYGQPADLDRLLPLARRHGAALIEDAAQAHGAWCTVAGERRRVGTIGDAGCFSFYPTKNLGAMGDAGALTTTRDDLAAKVRLIANHGEQTKYTHVIPDGRNSRLDALQAAVLRVKLPHLDDWNRARRAVAARYTAALAGLPLTLPRERAGVEHVYHQYAVRSAGRDALQQALTARGIGTGIHYPRPLHLQEGYRRFGYAAGAFPVSEQAAAEVLSLPMSPFLGDRQIDEVVTALRSALT
ncbi:MAG TPA: DegT/DnrJ/EryC1/StrS family aminotransferase [Candidatus Dormibacteraeota bacterium]|nr:DegT/DnrJ/EryC1/StrS family aminotransferase [Candidatus Dormibacteraeota bacterium]